MAKRKRDKWTLWTPVAMETIREDVRSSVRNLWHELRDREIMRTLAIVLSARIGRESSRELPATRVYIVSLVKISAGREPVKSFRFWVVSSRALQSICHRRIASGMCCTVFENRIYLSWCIIQLLLCKPYLGTIIGLIDGLIESFVFPEQPEARKVTLV